MEISNSKRNVILSTAEAEFVSLSEWAKHGIWFKKKKLIQRNY